jgi:hypothetical protein
MNNDKSMISSIARGRTDLVVPFLEGGGSAKAKEGDAALIYGAHDTATSPPFVCSSSTAKNSRHSVPTSDWASPHSAVTGSCANT